jgi:DNA-binding MarR family transcriptional regulator
MRFEEELLGHVRTLLRAFLVSERRLPSAEGKMSYSAHDLAALQHLSENPGCLPSQLAEALEIVPTTASSLIGRLAKHGFVTRRVREEDRRSFALELTPEGQDMAAAIRRQDLANMRVMLSALPEDRRADFVSMLGRVAEAVGASE